MQLEDALDMAWKQLDRFGLTKAGWSVALDERTRFLGHCSYEKKIITLSIYHLEQHGQLDVLDTILHEIAHALVGPGHDHDELWRAYARLCGARPQPCAACGAPRRSNTPSSVIYL